MAVATDSHRDFLAPEHIPWDMSDNHAGWMICVYSFVFFIISHNP